MGAAPGRHFIYWHDLCFRTVNVEVTTMYWLLPWLLLLQVGCVHTVHSLHVEDAKRALVDDEVRKRCSPELCSVKWCWMETEDIVFCTVEFSFVTAGHQREILS